MSETEELIKHLSIGVDILEIYWDKYNKEIESIYLVHWKNKTKELIKKYNPSEE